MRNFVIQTNQLHTMEEEERVAMTLTKKFFAAFVAFVMAVAMTIPATAFAAETTYSITAPSNGHTYSVYQIFTGDVSGESTYSLSNVKWGQNSKGTEGEAVDSTTLATLTAISSTASDTEKLAVIDDYADLTGSAYTTVASGATVSNVPGGYYFIVDNGGTAGATDDAISTYIVAVAGDVVIDPKSDVPGVDKQIHDETGDAEEGATDGWGESADHAINESFQFKLIATVGPDSNYAAYSTYAVTFHDIMSTGITFESIESVTVNGTAITDYTCNATAGMTGDGATEWTLSIADLKSYSGVDLTAMGATVEVIYNAHLNEDAYLNSASGTTSNKNGVYLTYSNNPYGSGEGATTTDYVWAFTYQVNNTKVNGSGEALGGAGFRLYTDSTCTNELYLVYNEAKGAYYPADSTATSGDEMFSANSTGAFNIAGLDAGTYYLKETTTPSGYNTMENLTITIGATHAEDEAGTSASVTLVGDNLSYTVENTTGFVLPKTGELGTFLLYAVGAALAVGAACALISRKAKRAGSGE